MGTTVNSLQIIGAKEDAIKNALPKAIVGKWSERFITACPGELAFTQLEKKAGWVSKKLDCTVLSVSLFDSDVLSLVLYVSGKRTARHVFNPETGESVLGNANAFCAGLELEPQTAPCLKRLFTDSDQEEKLQILSALLGAPLFARWDDPFETPEFQPVDKRPLHAWVAAHPLPPKIKNQACMELIQEFGERMPAYGAFVLILRPLAYADEDDARIYGCAIGSVVGNYCSGGEWARWEEDGRLRLTPLMEDGLENLSYAEADGRLLTFVSRYIEDAPGCYSNGFSTVVSDSAGLLPLPLPLTPDGVLTVLSSCHLLPNGGFLALFQPQYDMAGQVEEAAVRCYGADGACLWEWKGQANNVTLSEDRIYLNAVGEDGPVLHCLTLAGQLLHSVESPCEGPLLVSGAYLYQLERTGYRKDDVLHRFTLDLQDAGCLQVPYLSDMDISPDGKLLFCAGYSSGLMVIDLDGFELRKEVRSLEKYSEPVVDGKNRLWVHNGSFFECYSADLDLLSRHRLAGDILDHTLNKMGEVCLATYQRSKYLTRVYRFC